MKRFLFSITLALFFSQAVNSQAPGPVFTPEVLETKRTTFKEQSRGLLEELKASRDRAFRMAAEKGWLTEEVLPTGEIISLQGVDSQGFPIYYITDFNIRAAATTSTNKLWPGGSAGLSLNGSSHFMEGKLGIWDGGSVLETHQELAGRIILNDPGAEISSHATHVAGTMIAAGVNPFAKGMAFGARDLRSWDFNNDGNEMAQAASSLLLSNHSYGRLAGWHYNSSRAGTASDPRWEWRGNINVSTTEDFNFGYYDDRAKLWDMISYYAPYYLIVKSAGNNRNSNGPAIGEPFWRYDANGNWELISQRPPNMSSNDSYDIISTYGTAKNILTVGAVAAIEDGYRRPQDVVMSTFSSWGPTDDGRIKPDLVANGVSLYSSSTPSNNSYNTSSGTSMSAPNATGSLFLLQEHFYQLNNRFMLSSTLKGLVCHTADDAGNPGPDYIYGWGLLNAEKAAMVISNNGVSSLIEEIPLNSGETITRTVVASGMEPLVVSITWTDPEAEPLPINALVLNNRTPRLVNDLDLRVSDGSTTFLPWVLNPDIPSLSASKGDNVVDNIEQVVVANPVPGKTYTITISHKKETLVRAPQVFSLIATGIGGNKICKSNPASNADSRIDGFQLHTISNNTASGCNAYRDFTGTSARLRKGTTYPFTVSTGTCGEENPRIIKLFADWNSNGTFEPEEVVAVSPVITSSGDFTANLTVPNHVKVGATAVLRIVLAETNDPDLVQPCGEYQKGETQDYLLIFDRAQFDIGPTDILDIADGICASDEQTIFVKIENFGASAVIDFDVEAKIFRAGELQKTITERYPGALGGLSARGFLFNTGFATEPDTEYTLIVSTSLDGDINPDNDQISVTFRTNQGVSPFEARAIRCGTDNQILLSADADGLTYWYDRPENGKLLTYGNQVNYNSVPASGKIYGIANYLSGTVGPKDRYEEPWTAGGYSNFSGQTFFNTSVPLVIESARLHVGNPGEVTFHVEDYFSGEIVSVARLFVTSTTDNFGNDIGRVFPLNLEIPKPGTYRMRYTFGSGTTLYRANGQSSNPYPYSIPGVISFYGTNQTNSTGFYYYMYDMEISAPGCPSAPVEVTIESKPKPSVNLEETIRLEEGQYILDAANEGSTFLWNTGEITQTIAPQTPGVYTVVITNEWGCKFQASIQLTVTGVSDPNHINARVFPNPANSFLNIESPKPVRVELFNISGQKLFGPTQESNFETIDISSLIPGIYFVRLTETTTSYTAVFKVVVK